MESTDDVDRMNIIARKLDKMIRSQAIEADKAKKLLQEIHGANMTLAILQKTGLGIIINNLRKQIDDDEITTFAKKLIRRWKKLLPDSGAATPAKSAAPSAAVSTEDDSCDGVVAASAAKRARYPDQAGDTGDYRQSPPVATATDRFGAGSGSDDASPGATGSQASAAAAGGGDDSAGWSPDADGGCGAVVPAAPASRHDSLEDTVAVSVAGLMPSYSHTDDPVRIKSRLLLKNALEHEEVPSGAYDTDYLAAEIETFIFREFNSTGDKYRVRLRSRVMNLRDVKNPSLRFNVLVGGVSPAQMAKMASDEMASEEMKIQREKFAKESIDDHQLSVSAGTKTDLLKCRRCKQKNCSYNQVQTRSADEPMTTKVLCNECGFRWSFC